MIFFDGLPAAQSPVLGFIGIINLLLVFGILCSVAFLVATRTQVLEKTRIQGFEFMHEAEPLSPYEPLESYYLF